MPGNIIVQGHKKVPSACALKEREKKKTKIFDFLLALMRATLRQGLELLARPARSLKLFGTFLTFFSLLAFYFFILTVSHILFGLICWLDLSVRPVRPAAGQLQLSS